MFERKLKEIDSNRKNKNIRDIYRGINELRSVTNLEVI
jgi:hypothetical protein